MNIIRKPSPDKLMLNESNGVTYLTFPKLSEYSDFTHAFSTRLGGVSTGIYESMNLSFTRGDNEADVKQNFKLFADAVGVPYDSIVMSDQTHTTNVRVITEADKGNGLVRAKSFFDTDGLITNVPGITLFTSFADCVPLYFIDPVNKAIGLTHSGWRGTVGRIGKCTIEAMNREYGSKPHDIIAAIGPSICADCYEVSEDVAIQFTEEFGDKASQVILPQAEYFKLHGINKPAANDKYQLDLWQANAIILTEAGIKKEHLSITDMCTCCNPKLLFSHRASQGKRGNLAAVLMINP